MIQAIDSFRVANDISAGGQSAKDAVDGGAGVSGHIAQIFDAQAGCGPAERLDHLDCLEYTWDKVAGIPGQVRSLEHIDAPRRRYLLLGARFTPAQFSRLTRAFRRTCRAD